MLKLSFRREINLLSIWFYSMSHITCGVYEGVKLEWKDGRMFITRVSHLSSYTVGGVICVTASVTDVYISRITSVIALSVSRVPVPSQHREFSPTALVSPSVAGVWAPIQNLYVQCVALYPTSGMPVRGRMSYGEYTNIFPRKRVGITDSLHFGGKQVLWL